MKKSILNYLKTNVLMNKSENKYNKLVISAYNLLLDREPEPAGLKHWASLMQNGLTKKELVKIFVSSQEFKDIMGDIYNFNKFKDIDFIIPLHQQVLRVPSSDLSLVPHLIANKNWEPHITNYLIKNISKSDYLIDVGANLGYFTVLCAPLAKKIIAFEPADINYYYCNSNIILNNIDNVQLYKYGLWDHDKELSFSFDSSNLTAAHIVRSKDTSKETIQCISLDNMIKRKELDLPRLDFIKMDIEGSELFALNGMKDTLFKFKPKIIMEVNRPALNTFGKIIDDIYHFFSDINYRIMMFDNSEEDKLVCIKSLNDFYDFCPVDSLIDILAFSNEE